MEEGKNYEWHKEKAEQTNYAKIKHVKEIWKANTDCFGW